MTMSLEQLATTLKKDDFLAKILKDLECPVCYEYYFQEIYMCENGHNVCCNCRARLAECPLCKGAILNTRNLFAEHLILNLDVMLPCKYASKGCLEKLAGKAMENHLQACEYGFKCFHCEMGVPEKQCKWMGHFSDLLEHVESSHPSITTNGTHTDMICNTYTVSRCLETRLLYNCYGEMFWCILYYRPASNAHYAYVKFAGPKEKCGKFEYEFAFRSSDGRHELIKRGEVLNTTESVIGTTKVVPLDDKILGFYISMGQLKCSVKVLEKA